MSDSAFPPILEIMHLRTKISDYLVMARYCKQSEDCESDEANLCK